MDVSPEEQARRERMRMFTGGMMSYQWVGGTNGVDQKMIVPFGGRVLKAKKDGNFKVGNMPRKGLCTDPTMSPGRKRIASVEQDLYVMNEDDSSSLTRLTKHGAETGGILWFGDYLAQEDGSLSRTWWSPSSKCYYTETNENNYPCSTSPIRGKTIQRSLKHIITHFSAGYDNAKVKLAVLKVDNSASGGNSFAEDTSVWMNLAGDSIDPNDYYLSVWAGGLMTV